MTADVPPGSGNDGTADRAAIQRLRQRAGIKDYTCGLCGEEFGSNCDPGDIQCTDCEARLCPCCGAWFTEIGVIAAAAPGPAALREQLDATRTVLQETSRESSQRGADRDDYAARLKAVDQSWAKLAAERDRLREALDEIGVMAANAPEDGDCFAVCEEIAMRAAAAGIPEPGPDDDGDGGDGCECGSPTCRRRGAPS